MGVRDVGVWVRVSSSVIAGSGHGRSVVLLHVDFEVALESDVFISVSWVLFLPCLGERWRVRVLV